MEHQCFRMPWSSSLGWGVRCCAVLGPEVGHGLVVSISSKVVSTALCSAQAGEPEQRLLHFAFQVFLVLKDPCGVSRVPYFLQMFGSFYQDNLF